MSSLSTHHAWHWIGSPRAQEATASRCKRWWTISFRISPMPVWLGRPLTWLFSPTSIPTSGRAELMAAAVGVLGAEGHLFIVGHHVSSLGLAGPPDPERLYTDDDLRAVKGVEVVRLQHRRGVSDVDDVGTDVILWARRQETFTQAS